MNFKTFFKKLINIFLFKSNFKYPITPPNIHIIKSPTGKIFNLDVSNLHQLDSISPKS